MGSVIFSIDLLRYIRLWKNQTISSILQVDMRTEA